ncbi:MAG: TonB-dependent receptor domain-containing protein, partial [Gammaproteobacteria bacterium]
QGWPNQRMDMTGNDSTQVNLRYRGEYAWGDLEARAYRETTRHKMQFHDDKLFWYGPTPAQDGIPCTPSGGMAGCAAGMPMDTDAENTGVAVKADIPLSARDLLRVGGEVQQYRLDDWWDPSGKGMWPDTFWNIRDGERDRLAVYGEWEAQWNPQWLTLFGLRHETVNMDTGEVQGYNANYLADATAFNAADRDITDRNLDAIALARFTPDATRDVEFGYSRKTRSPNLYERYTWSTGGMAMRMINWFGDGNGYVGNLELEPETAHTLSATFDWHDAERRAWGLKVTPYVSYVDDYIDAERCSGGAGMGAVCTPANLTVEDAFVYLRFVNQDARLYGIDVSGYLPLAKSERLGEFTLNGLLNYVRGENEDTGDNLYNIMPLNTLVSVVQQRGAWTGTLEWQWVDDKDRLSWERNEQATKGYNLFNVRGSYAWKQVRLDVGVENLADKLYFHPLGGAYLGQGKTMSGGDVAWGTTVPGMGRTLYTAVNVKF